MKKIIFSIFIFLAIITAAWLFLNIPVSTQQCINYDCHALKIPLYLKTLDFFDRHFNYQWLTRGIIRGCPNQEGRVKKILAWTQDNLKKSPAGLPIVDDHVWHTIVRGYGVDDQFQDVFTTLCNYAGVGAFFTIVRAEESGRRKPLSFVRLGKKWCAIDAYNGVYFKNQHGTLASIEELIKGDCKPQNIRGEGLIADYTDYFRNLTSIDFNSWNTRRSAIQSPLQRLSQWLRHKKSKRNFTFFK